MVFKHNCQGISIKSSFAAPQHTTILHQALSSSLIIMYTDQGKGVNDGDYSGGGGVGGKGGGENTNE